MGFLGNWTQSLCEYLHGKQYNKPDSHESKISHHIIPMIGMDFYIFAETIINYSKNMLAYPQDDYSFKDNVLQTPKAYVDPSNLISKSKVSDISLTNIS